LGADAAGLTESEIRRVVDGPGAAGWEPSEETLCRAVDELHDLCRIENDTWQALSEQFNDNQLIYVVMLVGYYHMIGFVANALRIEVEPGLVGFSSN
jgi:hypothetical protein